MKWFYTVKLKSPHNAIYARKRAYANSMFARANNGFGSEQDVKKAVAQKCYGFFGAPAENRTPDTLIKSQVLYQLSYRGISNHA